MPQNRKRKPRKTPNNRASNTRHNPPDLNQPKGERQEMNGNDGKPKISVLTSRQQGALPVIAAAPTIAQAARDCRVAVIRRLALNLLKQEPSARVGIKAKLKKAGWDFPCLLKALSQ